MKLSYVILNTVSRYTITILLTIYILHAHNITVDCGIPLSPIKGSVLHYSGTKSGDYVTYKCNEGFCPSPAMNATYLFIFRFKMELITRES